MAAIFFLMKAKERKKQEVAVQRVRDDAAFIKDILRRFDSDHKRTLNFEEVRAWLRSVASTQAHVSEEHAQNEVDKEFPGTGTALASLKGPRDGSKKRPKNSIVDTFRDIEDDEVEWVMMMAMDRKEKGAFHKILEEGKNVKDLELKPGAFEYALRAWLSYVHNKPVLDEVMLKYGSNADGQMEKSSVQKMLTDLNGNVAPESSEVDWVMDEARAMPSSVGITKPELIKVMSLWYLKQLEKAEALRSEVEAAENAKRNQSSCSTVCIVS